jgi:hypothetical protein
MKEKHEPRTSRGDYQLGLCPASPFAGEARQKGGGGLDERRSAATA